ncbi:MAG: SsrA-binding protein SmpB [Cyclobacteriaceae bacterium]|nr:SsrA-binding protein SmpB [Cyclobacteriaceae bacterium HetDA_MAG_MS6]
MKSKGQTRFSNSVTIKNRKASFEYEFVDQLEVGIVLKGSEIKSIREGKASLQEAYCHFHRGELYIKSMNISPYQESTYDNHEPTRERKLLLKKREMEKLKTKSEEKGLTIIPTKLYINKRGFAKLEVALARGKKLYDKRESIKKREEDRAMKEMSI